jgi:hypothetical protein
LSLSTGDLGRLFYYLGAERPERQEEVTSLKVVGFNFRQEDEAHLQRLSAKLGWTRSQIVRELLARAVVEGPSVDVVLPAARPAEAVEVVHGD